MRESLSDFQKSNDQRKDVAPVAAGKADERYNPTPPKDGLIVRVRAKVLDGYEETDDRWRKIFQSAVSRDNLWISKAEHASLARGTVPPSLQKRIAMYHLVDNTRGEPTMWRETDVRSTEMKIDNGVLTGTVKLKNVDNSRGYEVDLRGTIETKDGRVVRFDVAAKGQYWGQGRYTRGAPKGKFPLAVTFELADGTDVADAIPPQGSRGWVAGYLR